MRGELKIEVETGSLLIVAYPHRNVVLISSKWGAFNHSMTVPDFCDMLDRVSSAKRITP